MEDYKIGDECPECDGSRGRWDEECQDQWHDCFYCDGEGILRPIILILEDCYERISWLQNKGMSVHIIHTKYLYEFSSIYHERYSQIIGIILDDNLEVSSLNRHFPNTGFDAAKFLAEQNETLPAVLIWGQNSLCSQMYTTLYEKVDDLVLEPFGCLNDRINNWLFALAKPIPLKKSEYKPRMNATIDQFMKGFQQVAENGPAIVANWCDIDPELQEEYVQQFEWMTNEETIMDVIFLAFSKSREKEIVPKLLKFNKEVLNILQTIKEYDQYL